MSIAIKSAEWNRKESAANLVLLQTLGHVFHGDHGNIDITEKNIMNAQVMTN